MVRFLLKTKRTVGKSLFLLGLTLLLTFILGNPGGVRAQADVTRFDIGQIPEQSVRQGYTLRFQVYSSALGAGATYSAEPSPAPVGVLTLDPLSGVFAYEPDTQDRETFTVAFTGDLGGTTVSQTVSVTPEPVLVPEADIISYVRPLPDPTGQTNILESDIIEDVELNHVSYPQDVNGETQYAKRVAISGNTVLFDKNIGPLYSFNGRDDIRDMIISADTVIIRDPLHLPQTAVTINARELRFEDRPGAAPEELARLITTPRTKETPARSADDTGTVPDNGEIGLPAGNVTANIAEFSSLGPDSLPATTERFDLTGGQGQKGGAGKRGDDGTPIPSVGWVVINEIWTDYDCTHTPAEFTYDQKNNVTYYYESRERTSIFCEDYTRTAGASNNWQPGNGQPAVADGKPGDGGPGGTFTTTLDLAAYANVGGGPAGQIGESHLGGAAGLPCPAWYVTGSTHYTCAFGENFIHGSFTATKHVSQPGADAVPGMPDRPFGDAGQIEVGGSLTGWMTPAGARGMLLYIKDAYLNGHIEEARAKLAEYLGYLDALEPATPAEVSDFEQLRQEMQVLYHRGSNNLDYFGNPAGWVPMLSFDANLAAFQNEVDDAIEVMYTTYWLNSKAEEALDKSAAMTYAKDKLKQELDGFIETYNNAQAALPSLGVEADNITARIDTLTQELAMIEEMLLARAQENLEPPWWKKALRVVGAGLKMIPAYQPVLGAIGGGFNILASVDSETSMDDLDSLLTAGEFAYTFKQADMVKKSDAVNRKLKELNKEDEGAYSTQVNDLHLYAKQIAEGLGPLISSFKGSQAPMDELQAELERLKASDPAFQKVSGDIRDLMIEKEVFARRIADLLQVVSDTAAGISQNMLGVVALNDNISENALKLNDRAFMYIKEMEKRAKDRLLKYQYYVMKAFEYRMLTPYAGELNLNRLFDAFQTLVDPGDHLLTAEEFQNLKNVYLEELSRVTAEMFDELNARPPELSVPITFGLTPDEIEQLNRDGFVYVNLREKNLFGRTEENLRIVSLGTQSVSVHPEHGESYGRTAVLRLKYEHGGISLLNSKGKTYLFNHYRSAAINPLTWKTIYDVIADTLDESTVSAASESLLRFLLEDELGHTNPDLVLYSLPGADADVRISKEELSETGEGIYIDDLRITVQYDYFEKRTDQSELEIRVNDGLAPIILLDSPTGDSNGRRDGCGNFIRVFNRGQLAQLSAPIRYGTWVFSRWVDPSGQVLKSLDTSATTTVQMDAHKMIQALYVNTADTTPPSPPIITTNGGSDFLIGFDSIRLEGTVSFDTARIEINGAEIPHTAGSGDWEAQVSLDVGSQVFEVVAIDEALNPSEPASITITYIPGYDTDGDGFTDVEEGMGDPDGDGIPNYLDPDSDNDGMPDEWERVNNLDAFTPNADADPDGDGCSNLLEYLYHTDPNDPLSFPRPGDLSVDRAAITLSGADPSVVFNVLNLGDLPLEWTATSDNPVIVLEPHAGTAPSAVTVSATNYAEPTVGVITVRNTANPDDIETVTIEIVRAPLPADLEVSVNLITLTAAARSAVFNVINLGDLPLQWTAESESPAVSVEPASGTGPAQVTLSAADFSEDRNVNVTVRNAENTADVETIVVKVRNMPASGDLAVSTHLLLLTEAAPLATFNVMNLGEESFNWSISCDRADIVVEPRSGSGPELVTVLATSFVQDVTAEVVVANNENPGDTESVVLKVRHTPVPGNLGVSTNLVTLTKTSPSAQLNVINHGDSLVQWAASSDSPVVSVAPSWGSGAGTITVSGSDFSRDLTANVTLQNVANTEDKEIVVVRIEHTPKPGDVAVSSHLLLLAETAPSATFNILNNGDFGILWFVMSEDDAATLDPLSGSSPGPVTVTAVDFSHDRCFNISVLNAYNVNDVETVVVHIRRTSRVGDLAVDKHTLTLTNCEKSATLQVTNLDSSELSWTAWSDSPVVALSQESGTGPGLMIVHGLDFSKEVTAHVIVANGKNPDDTEIVHVELRHCPLSSMLGCRTSNAPPGTDASEGALGDWLMIAGAVVVFCALRRSRRKSA